MSGLFNIWHLKGNVYEKKYIIILLLCFIFYPRFLLYESDTFLFYNYIFHVSIYAV